MNTVKNKMSWIILVLGLMISNLVVAQKGDGFVLEGNITGLKDGSKVYLLKNHGSDTARQTITKNGNFTFKGTVKNEAAFFYINIDTTELKNGNVANAFILENKLIRVNGSTTEWPTIKVAGSEAQDDYSNLIGLYKEIKAKSADKTLAENLNAMYKEFIKARPNSLYVSDLILKCESFLKIKGMHEAYNNLTPRAKKSQFAIDLKAYLEDKKNEIEIGKPAANFRGKTPDGKDLSLTEVVKKGKYTLIDFWATWCKPCMEEIPNVKKAYDAYHAKGFNVIGVTNDYSMNAWKNTIAKGGMPWFHVMGEENSKKINSIYGIIGIPATFLVDSNGILIAQGLRGEDLLEKLEELFGSKMK
jgi:thiol-disulfide isomerase/thioredoxin